MTRLSQITGEPEPRLGTATLHLMFSVGDQIVGGWAVDETLLPDSPRQWPRLAEAGEMTTVASTI